MAGNFPTVNPHHLTNWFYNEGALTAPTPFAEDHALARSKVLKAGVVVKKFPGYAPTPLNSLEEAAKESGLGSIFYKDESKRFHLKNFKALGGAYAVLKLVKKFGKDIVITSSTAGSHGRAIAWGAEMAGVRCVIYIAEGVSKGREKAMATLGAEVIRVPGRYEESFQAARKAAANNGWHMVCDTTFPGYDEIPLSIMQGYGVMVEEIADQLRNEQNIAVQDLTHVFLQAGCGGFAASIMAAIINHCGDKRPQFILVEPGAADCVLKSMQNGKPIFLEGDISTMMGGLEVAEVSMAAWPIFQDYADAVLAISDEAVPPVMKALAEGRLGGGLIEAGESSAVGLIGALIANANLKLKQKLALNSSSKILVIGTEGAADPDTFRKFTGLDPLL